VEYRKREKFRVPRKLKKGIKNLLKWQYNKKKHKMVLKWYFSGYTSTFANVSMTVLLSSFAYVASVVRMEE